MTLLTPDFKPETLEEKKQRKEDAEKKLVFKNVSFNEVRDRIAELIFRTSYFYKIKIDKNNPKILGGIMFWIETNDSNSPILMFNKHQSKWNRDSVILDLEQEEYQLLFPNNQFIQ